MANIPKPLSLSTVWAGTGTRDDPTEARINQGWVVELPPYQTQNWVDWRQDTAIAHINQHGIPEWDDGTEYQGNLSYTQGSDGVIYKCLLTNTNTNPTNPLNSAYWVQAFESYGAVAVVQSALTAHLANYATLAGISNTAAARVNLSVWSRTESDVRYAALAGNSTQTFSVAAATLPEHAIRLGQVSALLTQATESSLGVAALATNAKAEAGVDDLTIMTPLKTRTVYLHKNGNLAGLASAATARSNLGLGSIAVESAAGFLRTTNNLSDLGNAVTARANLGLTSTATQPETYFLRTNNNLSDVVDKPAARANLGLTSTAVTALSALMQKSENLAGLANVAAARANLGLTDIVTLPANFYLTRLNNLSDLGNVQTARNNLGLGSASTRNVVGVPSDINHQSSNTQIGYMQHPNGIMEKWGVAAINQAGIQYTTITFPGPAFTSVFNIQLTYTSRTDNDGDSCWVNSYNTSNFVVGQAGGGNQSPSQGVFWRAIGTYN